MEKFLLSIFISISMLTPAFAQASNAIELAEAVQTLEYNLSVEWDQKTQSHYDQYVNEFKKNVLRLKGEGLTKQDIVTYMKENYISKEKAHDFDELVALASSFAISEDILMANMSDLYKKGSSWTYDLGPDGPLIVGGTMAFFLFVFIRIEYIDNKDEYQY